MTPKNDELMSDDIKQAREILADWCSNSGLNFLMSIPVQGRDHDMIMDRVIRTAEKSIAAQGEDGWRTMESAPRDGNTRVLIYSEIFGILAWSISDEDMPDGATHWQPLPAPPRSGGAK